MKTVHVCVICKGECTQIGQNKPIFIKRIELTDVVVLRLHEDLGEPGESEDLGEQEGNRRLGNE